MKEFIDYKFKRKYLSISYIQKKMNRLKYHQMFSNNLKLYERFYLISDWRKIGKFNNSDLISAKSKKENEGSLGQSNIEIFEKMYGDSEIEENQINDKHMNEKSLNKFGNFKLTNAPPKLNDPDFEFKTYEYYRNIAHSNNLKYLSSRLEN
jgi:hypothetical protein